MPVNKPQLQASKKGFTQQDFLDGKCTKEGFPLNKAEPVEPEQPTTPEVESSPVADEAGPTEASNVEDNPTPEADSPEPVGEEAPADGQELPKEGE